MESLAQWLEALPLAQQYVVVGIFALCITLLLYAGAMHIREACPECQTKGQKWVGTVDGNKRCCKNCGLLVSEFVKRRKILGENHFTH